MSIALALAAAAVAGATNLPMDVTVDDLIERARRAPSLFVTKARVEEIRRRVATDPVVSNEWRSLVRRLDASLAKPVDIPERGGQWCHYFYCRKCASPLKSESPTRHVCTHCGEAHAGWPFDDVYVMNVHNENGKRMPELGFAYQMTGDRRYADRVRETLLGYAKAYPKYERHTIDGKTVNRSAGRVGPQTLEESMWLINLCQGYDMVSDVLSEGEKATIRRDLLLPSARLVHGHDKGIGNWQCWHLSSFGLAGLICGDRELVAAAVAGPCGYMEQLKQGVFDDGVWNECAWGYHFYTVLGLSHIFVALDNLGVKPPRRYKLMFDAAFGQAMPDWTFPALNDSGRHNLRHDAPIYELAWTWWKDPLHAWWLRQNNYGSMQGLTQGSARPAQPSEPPRLVSQLYPNGGLAVLRSNESGADRPMPGNYLSIDFGSHGGWHGHPDKLSVVLYSRGELLAEDPGMTGYGNPRQWGWYRTTLAHNTVVMDGTNQCPATGCCEAFATRGNATVVSCTAGEAYGAAKAGRLLALVGDVVLDYTWVRGNRAHDWEWSFHSRGAFTTPLPLAPITLPPLQRLDKGKGKAGMDQQNRGEEAWSWTHDAAEAAHDGLWRATWTKGKATLNLFQRAPAGVIRTGVGSGSPASEEFTLAVNRVCGRPDVAFATVMTLDGATDVTIDEIVSDPDGTEGFAATVKGVKYQILRSPNDSCRGRKARAVVIEQSAAGATTLELATPSRASAD